MEANGTRVLYAYFMFAAVGIVATAFAECGKYECVKLQHEKCIDGVCEKWEECSPTQR